MAQLLLEMPLMWNLAGQIVYRLAQFSKLLKLYYNFVFQSKKPHELTDLKRTLTLDPLSSLISRDGRSYSKRSKVSSIDSKKVECNFIEISIHSWTITARRDSDPFGRKIWEDPLSLLNPYLIWFLRNSDNKH